MQGDVRGDVGGEESPVVAEACFGVEVGEGGGSEGEGQREGWRWLAGVWGSWLRRVWGACLPLWMLIGGGGGEGWVRVMLVGRLNACAVIQKRKTEKERTQGPGS